MENENREIKTMPAFEATNFIEREVKNAYYLKSRAIPDNLGQMVDTLKAMLLKYMPHVTTRNISDGIEHFILHETTAALSVDMLFKAVKSKHTPPYEPRDSDIDGYRRPDLEGDTISLLDTLAAALANGRKAFFNPRREYAYLVMRGQLNPNACDKFTDKAKILINEERINDGYRRIDWNIVGQTNDLTATAKGLAVEDWLRSCNTRGVAPSAILAPLANEAQYAELRRTV
jgi:hypothetical protein